MCRSVATVWLLLASNETPFKKKGEKKRKREKNCSRLTLIMWNTLRGE